MKYYKEFIITSEPYNPEILSSILWQCEITGITEEVNCLKVFADGSSSINASEISEMLQKVVNEKLIQNFIVEENLFEDKNWNEEWEKSLNVIKVSDKIVIKPTFKEYTPAEGEIIINIVPKMSFGTGEHQTTKLVIKYLEKYLEKGSRLLDVGSGTGILSIIAIKLGAASATAVDNDEWCYENGTENCKINDVTEKVSVKLGEIKDIDERGFDIITANIQKNILIDISEQLKERLKKGGILILSGLLITDEIDITEHYKKLGFAVINQERMDEWMSFVLKL